jgi:hypothetical protein
MSFRVNLSSKPRDYTRDIATLLLHLRDDSKLASELPKLPSALIEAEALGLCRAQCLERFGAAPSIWRWSITPAGKRWLKAHPTPKPRSRSVGSTSEASANE